MQSYFVVERSSKSAIWYKDILKRLTSFQWYSEKKKGRARYTATPISLC